MSTPLPQMTDERLDIEIESYEASVAIIQRNLSPNDDPWASPQAQELLRLTRMRSNRKLQKLHPGNRFRLMFGQPLLKQ